MGSVASERREAALCAVVEGTGAGGCGAETGMSYSKKTAFEPAKLRSGAHLTVTRAVALLLAVIAWGLVPAESSCTTPLASDGIPITLQSTAVLATGNNWIALPEIRANDGAIVSFNVLSMRQRGLLQVQGSATVNSGPGHKWISERKRIPAVAPWVKTATGSGGLRISQWHLIDYWIPVASAHIGSVHVTLTYVTPPHERAAWIRMVLVNRGKTAQRVKFGVTARWGGLARVIYHPSMIRGRRLQSPAPSWIHRVQVFNFVESDTVFSWALGHPDCSAAHRRGDVYTVDCQRKLAPGQRAVANFTLSVGLDKDSAEYAANVLDEELAHWGARTVLDSERQWLKPRLRTTGNPRLDVFMNRNLLFSSFFAWGRTLDTEQFVGVTSRSPRYYVAAAYWDRDAMLWSFPALLATDIARARRALDVALGIQLRNAGTHSRFIDGVVLEPGYELDENAAPIIALFEYWRETQDSAYVRKHRQALRVLLKKLAVHRGLAGLYWTEQDSQDENRRWPYETYDNVLVWRALRDAAALYRTIGQPALGRRLDVRAKRLRGAIMRHLVATGAPGTTGPIFAFGWNGRRHKFDDVPPGSLLDLPALGFISQHAPVFRRTYRWLHSKYFPYSNIGKPYGLPGSYRLPFTTCWTIADELRLRAGRKQALRILLASPWDGGIVSEQLSPETDASVSGGGGFATAAGYLASTICQLYCRPRSAAPATRGSAFNPWQQRYTHDH